MDTIIAVLTGGASGAIISWLARAWISERLKQSIGFEYSQKLESYKTELNAKVETIKHENQVSQLRTSLFFDHQREAYAALLSTTAQINEDWAYLAVPEDGLWDRVPDTYKNLDKLILKHQLFLDDDCAVALQLLQDTYFRSFPFDAGDGSPPYQNETSSLLVTCEYIQPRLASIFKSKIGMENSVWPLKEITVLAGVTYLNRYHFRDVDVPPKGPLNTEEIDNVADIVRAGLDNFDDLLKRIEAFDGYLSRDGGFFHEAQMKVKRVHNILVKLS